jgi:hypothetical protein
MQRTQTCSPAMLDLHQKWSKDYEELEDYDIKESAEMNDGVPQKFTRMV